MTQFDRQRLKKATVLLVVMMALCLLGIREVFADTDLTGIRLMGLDKASARFANVNGSVTVAVIDSGIDKEHDWFQGRIDLAHSVNLTEDRTGSDYSDDSGHGTHVAGIIAKGTPPQVKIMAIRIMQKGSSEEDVASAADLIAAINYAAEHGADVINMSLGYDTDQLKYDLGGSYAPLDDALQNALDKGCVILVASGNEGTDIARNYLAATSRTISVGAIGDDPYTGEYTALSISNFGEALDFTAPGYYIESAVPGNTTKMKTGTSMACPHAAAAAAILKLMHPDYRQADVYREFQRLAVDMAPTGRDPKTGYGYVDLSNYDGLDPSEHGSAGESTGRNDPPKMPGKAATRSTSTKQTVLPAPSKVNLQKLKKKKKKIQVRWKPLKNVSGYQIRYRYPGQRSYQYLNISRSTASKTYLRHLKSKKKYSVQIRAYRKSKGSIRYGSWSRTLRKKV